MSMKTPEQIAEEYAYTVDAYQDSAEEVGHPDGQPIIETFPQLAGIIERAIEADRAQRGIIEQIAECLDGRGAVAAAALVRDTDPDDDLWNNYIGPMIDSIEDDYTASAAEIQKEGQK